jgi:hypothetical protein
MPHRVKQFLFCSFAIMLVAKSILALEIKAELSRDKIYLGESFILQLSINGCSELNNITFENTKDCTVKFLGSQKFSNYSVSMVNGKVARQEFVGVVASYEIRPNRAGIFNPGNITVEADGNKYVKKIDSITVTDIEDQDVVKIIISASKETALIDEPFDVTLSLLIKQLPGTMAQLDPLYSDNPPALSIPWLDDPAIASFKGTDVQSLLNQLLVYKKDQPGIYINNYTVRTDSFSDPFDFSSFFESKKAKFMLPGKIIETNGISYFEYSIKFTYSSREEGNFVFGPVVFKGDVPTASRAGGNVTPLSVFAVGKAATVRVVPPPERGRPASFIGAIGSNMFLKAALDVNECYVGDPIKLTFTLTGNIRFDKVFPPFITNQTALTELFTIYEDSLKIERSDNSIQFVYTIRPRKEGSYSLPPIEMAYFDTVSRSYKKVLSAEVPLVVKRGKEITAKEIIASSNLTQLSENYKTDPATLPIVSIKTNSEGIAYNKLLPEPVWLAVLVACPLAYLLFILFQSFASSRQYRLQIRLKKNAYNNAKATLKKLGLHNQLPLQEQSRILCKIIAAFFAEKLNLKTEGITPAELKTLLKKLNLSQELVAKLMAIFTKNFNNTFSNKREINNQSEMEESKEKVSHLLKNIEDEMNK